ncbi:MAG: DUF1801 domain-containing protein [Solobacterium sp.]|nr:DUF1801 domain-containing protein [Solobacterium sp.]
MTIQEYIDAQEEAVRPRLTAVYDTIRKAIPDAEETISWGMPTFRKRRNLIHFAAMKNHIGLYPGPEAVEAFTGRLKGYRTSKGTIRLPHDQDLPLELIADIARWSRENNKQ